MKGYLKLGKVKGIQLAIHWTFPLLLLWVGVLEFQNRGNLEGVLMAEGLVMVLMVCVVLHEFGHALMAKRFHIQTKSIVILPIGGVATLDKMPDKPGQELLVALAGPAVNVLIAILIALFVPIRSYFNFDNIILDEQLYLPTLRNFLFYLFVANVMLVVFNLIPAFPMDGGRVLRALLSFKLGRVKATQIAAGIGQALAILFFIIGLFFNPFLILIAVFIFFGAYGENQMVQQHLVLGGHTVEDATVTNITKLSPDNSIQEVIEIVLAGTEKDFVVLSGDSIVGILTQKDIIKHAGNPSLRVNEIMERSFKTFDNSTALTTVLELIAQGKSSFFPVTRQDKFIGVIDRVNISEFILFKTVTSRQTEIQ